MPGFKRFEGVIDTGRENQLEALIERHAARLTFAQTAAKPLIVQAYRVEKPLTGVELLGQNEEVVARFIDDLADFFYVDDHRYDRSADGYSGEVFLSRFEHLPEIAVTLDGMSDRHCDVAGLLYGVPLEHVAGYSLRHGQFK